MDKYLNSSGFSQQAGDWIRTLDLVRHPEGGFFVESYRSGGVIPGGVLSAHAGPRPFMSSIYFMLPTGDISRFHRLKSDEIWYHHAGGSISIHQIAPDGKHSVFVLGQDLATGQKLQIIIKAGCWFGAIADGGKESLTGCAVAPGFDYADFELGKRAELLAQYPQHEEIISKLT